MKQNTRKVYTNIVQKGISIYDIIEIGDPELWYTSEMLEEILNAELIGISLSDMPLRTRSKFVNEKICQSLGYPTPSKFLKVKPRFTGQNFDKYTQKSNNLQIWNDELSPNRRYVIIKIDQSDIISKVKVIDGETLAKLDTTGTLTQKYQAKLIFSTKPAELFSPFDTSNLYPFVSDSPFLNSANPTTYPNEQNLLSINSIFNRLEKLIGLEIEAVGADQERNRGGRLHKEICKALGYNQFLDDGRFPDIKNQLLEVKFQTSTTVDLGLVSPDSTEMIDIPALNDVHIRHCDVRYAIFYGTKSGLHVKLTHLFLVTGEDFYKNFKQFQGKIINKKLQIPLPSNFFD